MTGKEFLDKEYGQPRGNGNGMASMLDKFSEEKVKDALKRLPRHKILVKSNPSIDGLEDREIETVEVEYLLKFLDISEE